MRPMGFRLSLMVSLAYRLDDQPRAVGGECLADVAGGAEGVAHVVQAVEGGRQVITGAGELRGAGSLEGDPVGHSGVAGPLAGNLD